MNVIIIDWYDLAIWDYFSASKGNTMYVAQATAAFIHSMAAQAQMTPQRKAQFLTEMILLGHSLGCHLAGLIGHLLHTSSHSAAPKVAHAQTGGISYGPVQRPTIVIDEKKNVAEKVGIIIGLDPAGPLFPPTTTERHCLSYKDGKKVVIVHTGDVVYGNSHKLGHQDYFFNGGWWIIRFSPQLSHMRAGNIFRALIWKPVTGYICMKSNLVYRARDMDDETLIKRIVFDLTQMPEEDETVIKNPIYVPASVKEPFFSDATPQKIPAHSVTQKDEWQKIKF